MRGLFITFEGIDGCGKSTQAELLLQKLKSLGHEAILLREPGGTAIGERIRSILLDIGHSEMNAVTELLLYSAARAQITAECIVPALEKGTMVIMDRYYDSTTAYQGYARGIDLNRIDDLNTIASGCLVPDITFLIDCDPSVSSGRISSSPDRLESEGLHFMRKVRDGFLQLSSKYQNRFVVIDGGKEIEKIAKQISETIKDMLNL